MRSKPTMPRVCRTCGASFLAYPSNVRRGYGNYCPGACRYGRREHLIVQNPDGLTALVPIIARNGSIRAYATIDIADADWVGQWRWHYEKGYAVRSAETEEWRGRVALHREILGLPWRDDGREGDHIDRDRLNNRRSNLRVTTHPQNSQNHPGQPDASSAHRGVTWDRRKQKWRAQVGINGKTVYLGRFESEHEAAEAARAGRKRLMPFAVD